MSRETAARDVTLNALAVLTGGLTAAAFVGTSSSTTSAAGRSRAAAPAPARLQASAPAKVPAPSAAS